MSLKLKTLISEMQRMIHHLNSTDFLSKNDQDEKEHERKKNLHEHIKKVKECTEVCRRANQGTNGCKHES